MYLQNIANSGIFYSNRERATLFSHFLIPTLIRLLVLAMLVVVLLVEMIRCVYKLIPHSCFSFFNITGSNHRCRLRVKTRPYFILASTSTYLPFTTPKLKYIYIIIFTPLGVSSYQSAPLILMGGYDAIRITASTPNNYEYAS
jgi:hypothetical protein